MIETTMHTALSSDRAHAAAERGDALRARGETKMPFGGGACLWANLLKTPYVRGTREARWWNGTADSPLQEEGQAKRMLFDLLERGKTLGFGAVGLFEPALESARVISPTGSRWDRPIRQFSTLPGWRQTAIAETAAWCREAGLELHWYMGTLDGRGYDVVPDAVEIYLTELERLRKAGVDRVYIDATSYNADTANLYRRGRVGGGARRDGVLAIRDELARLNVPIEVGVEPWPLVASPSRLVLEEAAPALIAGVWLINRVRAGRIDVESINWTDGDLRVALFNRGDIADRAILDRVAARGVRFDLASDDGQVTAACAELSVIAAQARAETKTIAEAIDALPDRPSTITTTKTTTPDAGDAGEGE